MKNSLFIIIFFFQHVLLNAQAISTETLHKSNLYHWPELSSSSGSTIPAGAKLNVVSFINGFWRILDGQTGIVLYYIPDSCLIQNPMMDSIKKFVPGKYEGSERKHFGVVNEQSSKKSVVDEKIEKALHRKIPLFLIAATVTLNSIGTPEVTIIPGSLSLDTIDAYTVSIYCYNNFDEPVNHYSSGSNIFKAISQETINPFRTEEYGNTWTLYGFDNTRKVKVYLIKVHFTNGKTWVSPDKTWMVISGKY